METVLQGDNPASSRGGRGSIMGSGTNGVAGAGADPAWSIVSPSGRGVYSKGGEGGGSETLSILDQGAISYDGGTPLGEEIVDGGG